MHRYPPLAPVSLLLAVAACGPTAPPASAPPPPRAAPPAAGLDRVMGQSAPALAALFGTPALDVREAPARKLQFRSPACVLDAYLYPSAGGGDPKVTWIDARTLAGADFDRASCIASLVRVDPTLVRPAVVTPARTAPAASRRDRQRR